MRTRRTVLDDVFAKYHDGAIETSLWVTFSKHRIFLVESNRRGLVLMRLAMFLIPAIDPGPHILTSFRTRDRQAPPRRFIILVLNEAGVNELMMRFTQSGDS